MAKVPGPYIPTLDEATKLGITDPKTLEMLQGYHSGMAEPISQPTPPPEPFPTMPETPPPGPPPDFQEQPEFGIDPLPEPDMAAYGNQFVGDDQLNNVGADLTNPDEVEENENQYSEDQLAGIGGGGKPFDYLSPDLRKALNMQTAGEFMKAQGAAAQANAESAYLTQLQANMEEQQKDRAVKELARQKQVDKQMEKLNTAMTAFQEAKVDPKRMWTSASSGQKALMGISLALGALGSSYTGKDNKALGIIQKAIADDIQIQKAEIAKLGDTVTMKRNLLQDMRAMFDDERDAEDAAKIAMLDGAKIKLQQIAAQYKSPQIQGQAMRAAGDLTLAQEEIKAKFAERAALRALTKNKDGLIIPEKLKPWYVNGYGIAQAGTEKEVADFRKQVATVTGHQQKIARLMQLAEKGSKLNSDDRNEAYEIATMLQAQLREEIVGPGAVTDSERAILKEIAPNPLKFIQWPGAVKRLQTLNQGLTNNLDNNAAMLLLKPNRKQTTKRKPRTS